jgi:hypothetical protein
MGYTIIWLSYLAFWLLLIATISAYGAPLKSIFFAKFWPLLAFWLIFLINLIPVVMAIGARVEHIRPTWLLPYALIFFVCFIVGSRIILHKGLKKAEDRFMAYQWSRAHLSIALGIILFIFIGTLNIMDLKMIGDQNRLLVNTTGAAIELLPGKVPEDLDAGKYYDEASKTFAEIKKPDWFNDCLNADFIPESEEVAGFITANQEILDLLKLAGEKPAFNMRANPSNMMGSPILQYGYIRDSMRLFGLSAKLKALREGPEAALAELETMKNFSEHLYRRPTLLDQMVAVFPDNMRASVLEFILSRTPFPKKHLIVKPVKPSFSIIPFFRDAVQSEHVSIRQVFSLDLGDILDYKFKKVMGRLGDMIYRIFLFPDDLESIMEIQKQESDAFEKPFPDAIKILNDLNKTFSGTQSLGILTKKIPLNSPYYIRANEAAARRSLIDIALAATAYKADKGEFPTSLEVLVPDYIEALPNDPFDEKPMKFNAIDGGLDIYSIGGARKEGEKPEAIHFYLGAELYDKYRYQPAFKNTKAREKK